MNCPRCKRKDVLDKDGVPVCKRCNTQEYYKEHQATNPDRLGDFF